MKFLRRFCIRLSNLAAGRSADQRLREELEEHLAFQTEENVRAGMSPAEARRQAALKLGAAQAIREDHHAEQSLPLIENLLFDLRYAMRMRRLDCRICDSACLAQDHFWQRAERSLPAETSSIQNTKAAPELVCGPRPV